MFRLQPNPTFECSVPLSRPELEQPVSIKVTFKHKGKQALAEFISRAPGREDVDHLSEIIAGWSGVTDADGNAVPYSYDNLHKLLESFPPAAGELHRAFLRELTEAKRKN